MIVFKYLDRVLLADPHNQFDTSPESIKRVREHYSQWLPRLKDASHEVIRGGKSKPDIVIFKDSQGITGPLQEV